VVEGEQAAESAAAIGGKQACHTGSLRFGCAGPVSFEFNHCQGKMLFPLTVP